MAESTGCTDFLNLAKRLAEEMIVEMVGAGVDCGLTTPNLAGKLGKKIGEQRMKSFKKYLSAATRRGSDADGAWNTFVKSVKCLGSERRKASRSPWKVKLKNSDRKQEIRKSKEGYILGDLSIYKYRMALLCEALKTALDSHKDGGGFDYQGSGGNTVLHFLSALPLNTSNKQAFSEEIIEFLVKNNIDHSIKNHKSLTALHILAGNYVLDPTTNFEPSAIGRGLQCTTSTNGRYKVLSCFVMTNAFDVRGPHGNSILHEWVIQRAIRGNEDDERMNDDEERIGTWIMAVARVSPNKTNDYGCTPLHYAFASQVFEFLCEQGAEKNRSNECGETPFMYFLKHRFLRGYVANSLSSESETLPPESGEDSQSDIPKLEDPIDTTLSSCLGIKKNDDKNLENLIEFTSMPTLETLEKLAKAGFDFNEKDGLNDERDCLDYLLCILRECVCEGCKEKDGHKFKTFKSLLHCIKVLIENHSAILSGKKTGRRAPLYQVLVFYFDSLEMLHEEIRSLVVEDVVKPMLAGEADPNTTDRNKDTVLHFCCQKVNPRDKQQENLVKLLREYGASAEAKNNKGETPIKILQGRHNQKCSELARSIATLKPLLRVNIDFKSERYKDGLDKLCRVKCPEKEESIRYDRDHIGNGAMSVIFLAVDEKSKREVALKRIEKTSFEKELQNEIKSLVKLEENSHVVQYYRLVENSSFYFLALELMEGDLSYLVKEHQSLQLNLGEEVTLKLSADVVKGLSFLHDQNILHRDLKPGNILYRLEDHRKPCLKLADFGLAKHMTPSVNQSTVSGGSTSSSLTGTRGWMAPELVRREVHNHSKSTDMFALGLVIHFLISKGFHPFDKSGEPIFVAVSKGTLKPHELETGISGGTPEHLWKDLTPEARHLMELLLCDDPSLRPPAEDLLKQHCYFWSKLKKVEFMKTVGDQKEIAQPSMLFVVVSNLEATPFGDHVRNNPWNNKIPHLWGEISLRRSYDIKTVVDLIRFFRNAYSHFQERSEQCKSQLLNDIFFAKFPDFFLTVWKVVRYDMGWLEAKSGRDWLLRVVNEYD